MNLKLSRMKGWVVLTLILCSCGGKLSDEQRKKLHEGMATQDIKRVSEADLQEAALLYARAVLADVEKVNSSLSNPSKIDSIARTRQVRIYSLIPDDATLREIEKQLVDAYLAGSDVGEVGDNLQKVGEDSLLFTKPVFKNRPDGSQQFSHAIGIKMAKKTIVLSIPSL
jgi:hypothetical protein